MNGILILTFKYPYSVFHVCNKRWIIEYVYVGYELCIPIMKIVLCFTR